MVAGRLLSGCEGPDAAVARACPEGSRQSLSAVRCGRSFQVVRRYGFGRDRIGSRRVQRSTDRSFTASAATTSAVAATGRARRATGRPKALRERRSQPDRKPAPWIGDNGVRVPSAIRKKAAVRSAAAVKTVRRRAANGRVGSVAPDVAETAAATVKTAAVKVATATVAASAAGRAAAPIAAAVREMPTVRRRALRGRTAAARAIRSNGPKRDGRGCVRRWTNPPARADS